MKKRADANPRNVSVVHKTLLIKKNDLIIGFF